MAAFEPRAGARWYGGGTMADPLLPAPLRYFLAIAEQGSYTGAAKALHMSQPALTAAMNALEAELGTTLFVRTARGARLTATGEELVLHARGLLQRTSELRHAISDLEGAPRGRFVLGCHESLGAYFLPGFARRSLRIPTSRSPSGTATPRTCSRRSWPARST